MKIFITGGTGLIGKPLCEELASHNHELFVLSRSKRKNSRNIDYILWDDSFKFSEHINGMDIVINLAGEPIAGKPWSKEQKKKLRDSRINITREIVNAINTVPSKPKKLINASAVGIYGDRKDEKIKESSDLGEGFLADICKEWEIEAGKVETRHGMSQTTNVVLLRIGIVLGKGGGALEKMVPPFQMFIGGPLGSGKQWMPWIALEDAVGIIKLAVEKAEIKGIINVTSPNPVTNKEFSNILGNILFRPSFMPVPAFGLKLLLGEMADMLLGGQYVIPDVVSKQGYIFKHPRVEETLRKILI